LKGRAVQFLKTPPLVPLGALRYSRRSMARGDWFRNTVWNDEVSQRFFAKLARARDKAQYLRIQAWTLTSVDPKVALELLERYFALGDHFDHAQARVDQAAAYVALGDHQRAVEAYELALVREREYPNLRTQAAIDLPFLIATRRMREHYDTAMRLVRQSSKDVVVLFPVDVFKQQASIALISADLGDQEAACDHAARAIEAANLGNSGFRYHPTVGLVGSKFDEVQASLTAILNQ
jgi:tetratricopeptide (TPR) repeat protein